MKSKLKSIFTPTIREAKGDYACGNGFSCRLTVLAFESDLYVGGRAQFAVSLHNNGVRIWAPARLVLRWKVKDSDGGELILANQSAAEVAPLPPGKTRVVKGVVTVPLNSVLDVDIEFHLMSVDNTNWQPKDRPALLRRHISGLSAEDAPADFDYEVMYRTVDLQKDWWTPVGPATRAEYESLGRGKCAQLTALGLGPSSRVLDIGCGTGQLTEALVPILSAEGLYYGTDVAEPAVEFCRTKFPQTQFHFVKNEQTTIPINGVEFDIIYLGSVFTHVPV